MIQSIKYELSKKGIRIDRVTNCYLPLEYIEATITIYNSSSHPFLQLIYIVIGPGFMLEGSLMMTVARW